MGGRAEAAGLSGVTECGVTGRTGRAAGGERGRSELLKRGLLEGGDSGVVGLDRAEGRRGRRKCLDDGVKGWRGKMERGQEHTSTQLGTLRLHFIYISMKYQTRMHQLKLK